MNIIKITFFKILKIKYVIKISIYDINLVFIIYIYINVFKFAAKCVIIQFQILLKNDFL